VGVVGVGRTARRLVEAAVPGLDNTLAGLSARVPVVLLLSPLVAIAPRRFLSHALSPATANGAAVHVFSKSFYYFLVRLSNEAPPVLAHFWQ
jgi:hypothetical protein